MRNNFTLLSLLPLVIPNVVSTKEASRVISDTIKNQKQVTHADNHLLSFFKMKLIRFLVSVKTKDLISAKRRPSPPLLFKYSINCSRSPPDSLGGCPGHDGSSRRLYKLVHWNSSYL